MAEKVPLPSPPAELVQRVWHRYWTYEERSAAHQIWCEARRAWLSRHGWTEEELADIVMTGRPVPPYLREFCEAGGVEPFNAAAI